MFRTRWVRIRLAFQLISFQNEEKQQRMIMVGLLNLISTHLPLQPAASAASPAHPLSLCHAAGEGGVSGVSARIPATRHLQLEQVRKERSQHLPPAHPPGPGGQLRV